MTQTIIQTSNLYLPTILIPLLPLLGFFINALFGKKLGHASGWIATAVLFGAFACSLFLFLNLPAGGSETITISNWFYFKNIFYLRVWNQPRKNCPDPFLEINSLIKNNKSRLTKII